jgi:hypothetical protein
MDKHISKNVVRLDDVLDFSGDENYSREDLADNVLYDNGYYTYDDAYENDDRQDTVLYNMYLFCKCCKNRDEKYHVFYDYVILMYGEEKNIYAQLQQKYPNQTIENLKMIVNRIRKEIMSVGFMQM